MKRQDFNSLRLVHPEGSVGAHHISEAVLEANSGVLFRVRNSSETPQPQVTSWVSKLVEKEMKECNAHLAVGLKVISF